MDAITRCLVFLMIDGCRWLETNSTSAVQLIKHKREARDEKRAACARVDYCFEMQVP
jgi:hypothetical protein